MLEKAKQVPDLMLHLPDEREIHLLPRQWLANVIYTRYGQPFKDWVDAHIKARHEKFASKNNLLINMDPEIAQALTRSTQISSKFLFESDCMLLL
jgi:hypothetical protein